MHEYTVWQIRRDRIQELTREADARRLAMKAREGRSPRPSRPILRWFSPGLFRLHRRAAPTRIRDVAPRIP